MVGRSTEDEERVPCPCPEWSFGAFGEERVGAEADVEPLVQVVTTNLQRVQEP